MHATPTPVFHPARILMLGAALACPPALAADTGEGNARYRQERAVCESGQSNQSRAACLDEANSARAQARRGALDDGAAPYAENASKRCDALPDADRNDCLARMQGQGTTSGSVAAGGIYRELVVLEPAAPTAETGPPAEAPR
jgi:hypothetical protein